MYRGSTPKFTFPVTFPINELEDFRLAFKQGGDSILVKKLSDCETYTEFCPKTKKVRNLISIRLTSKETLMFEAARQLHIQLRAKLMNTHELVTKELETYVYDTYYDGDFSDDSDDESEES